MAEVRGDLAIKRKADVLDNARFHKGVEAPYLEVLDEKVSGVEGGTFSANVWRTRDLTTTVFNDFATSITLAASPGQGGQIVLPAGIYYVEAECPAFNVNEHVARLADVTDNPGQFGDTVVLGTSEFSPDTAQWRDGANLAMTVASAAQTRSRIVGKFQLERSTTLEIQHRCAKTQATDGFGSDGGFYITDNVYTAVRMWLIRSDA